MIAAIRASDQTRTIIFGDVQWYAIGALAVRKPLSDGNVIYAIHTYEKSPGSSGSRSWTPRGW